MTIICERCCFPASDLSKLIKHLKDAVQCRPIKSKISHEDLIKKLKPPPTQENLTCKYCKLVCKSSGGLKTHSNKCKAKINTTHNNDEASTSASVTNTTQVPEPTSVSISESLHEIEPIVDVVTKDVEKRKKPPTYFHKNLTSSKELQPFSKDINWDNIHFSDDTYLECCINCSQGIVDMFALLHNIPEYENIKAHQGKIIVFDGKGWKEVNEDMFPRHLGEIYTILEEKWCDYQMNIRCGLVADEDILNDDEMQRIDEFFYRTIVDDESVFFHCANILDSHLETLKSFS